MKKTMKSMIAATLAVLMAVGSFTAPNVSAAEANIDASIDDAYTTSSLSLGAKVQEITIGKTDVSEGKYKLTLSNGAGIIDDIGENDGVPYCYYFSNANGDTIYHSDAISKLASDYFGVVDNNTISYISGYTYNVDSDGIVKQTPVWTDVDVTWKSNLPSYASVSSNAIISANKVCKYKDEDNKIYKQVVITATVPDEDYIAYKIGDEKGKARRVFFRNGIVSKYLVTVVPETDLLVYYEGVWDEDYKTEHSTDGQHRDGDYAVTGTTKSKYVKLLEMALDMSTTIYDGDGATHYASSGISDIEDAKVTAITKTNNNKVRIYYTVKDDKDGVDYYCLKFNTKNDYTNSLNVMFREYEDNEYIKLGTYYRGTRK